MDALSLGAKGALAVLLLAAGGAKLADLPGFTSAVALFAPAAVPRRMLRAVALAVALAELTLGGASLGTPSWRWVNLAVLVLSCGFVAVSVAGYVAHRGRACKCFGALSQRRFDAAGIVRAALITAVAVIAAGPVPAQSVQLGLAAQLLLLGSAALVAGAACTAARALAAARDARLGWPS
jgi:hypothetical protein